MAYEQSKRIFIKTANECGYDGFKDIASIIYSYLEYDEPEFVKMVRNITKEIYEILKKTLESEIYHCKLNFDSLEKLDLNKIIYDVLYLYIGIDYVQAIKNVGEMIASPRLNHYINYIKYAVGNPIPQSQDIKIYYNIISNKIVEVLYFNLGNTPDNYFEDINNIINVHIMIFFDDMFTKRKIIKKYDDNLNLTDCIQRLHMNRITQGSLNKHGILRRERFNILKRYNKIQILIFNRTVYLNFINSTLNIDTKLNFTDMPLVTINH